MLLERLRYFTVVATIAPDHDVPAGGFLLSSASVLQQSGMIRDGPGDGHRRASLKMTLIWRCGRNNFELHFKFAPLARLHFLPLPGPFPCIPSSAA